MSAEPTAEQHRVVDDETVRDAGFVVSGVAHLLPQDEWESLRLDVARALAAAVTAEREKYLRVADELHARGTSHYAERVHFDPASEARNLVETKAFALAEAARRIREVSR